MLGPFFCPWRPAVQWVQKGTPGLRAPVRSVHVNYPIADAANNEHGGDGP